MHLVMSAIFLPSYAAHLFLLALRRRVLRHPPRGLSQHTTVHAAAPPCPWPLSTLVPPQCSRNLGHPIQPHRRRTRSTQAISLQTHGCVSIPSTLQPREDHLAKLQRALLQTTPAGTFALARRRRPRRCEKCLMERRLLVHSHRGPHDGPRRVPACAREGDMGGCRLGPRRVLPHSSPQQSCGWALSPKGCARGEQREASAPASNRRSRTLGTISRGRKEGGGRCPEACEALVAFRRVPAPPRIPTWLSRELKVQ